MFQHEMFCSQKAWTHTTRQTFLTFRLKLYPQIVKSYIILIPALLQTEFVVVHKLLPKTTGKSYTGPSQIKLLFTKLKDLIQDKIQKQKNIKFNKNENIHRYEIGGATNNLQRYEFGLRASNVSRSRGTQKNYSRSFE